MNNCLECEYCKRRGFYRFEYYCEFDPETRYQFAFKRFEKSTPVVLMENCTHFVKGSGTTNCLECIHLKEKIEKQQDKFRCSYTCGKLAAQGRLIVLDTPGVEEKLTLIKNCKDFVKGQEPEKTKLCPMCDENHSLKDPNAYCSKCLAKLKEAEIHLAKLKQKSQVKPKPKLGQRKIQVKTNLKEL